MPRPAGFPRCHRCPFAAGDRPDVCLACVERSSGGVGGHRCPSCDRPVKAGSRCPNPGCGRADRGWTSVIAVAPHAGALRRALAAYKYRAERRWAPIFASVLAGMVAGRPTWFEELDLLVPMPGYLGPGARRGWDPVGEVVDGVDERLAGDWEVDRGALVKRSETPAMQGRDGRGRAAVAEGPLRGSLAVPEPGRVAGRRILVVDDVLTSGASLGAAARALRAAGAAEVAGLVLARRGGPPPGCDVRPAGPMVSGCRPNWSS